MTYPVELIKIEAIDLLDKIIKMEYVIRATALSDRESYQKLKETNQKIKEFWQQKGIPEGLLTGSHVLKVSWAYLQGNKELIIPLNCADLKIPIESIFEKNIRELLCEFEYEARSTIFDFDHRLAFFNLSNANNILNLFEIFLRLESKIAQFEEESNKVDKDDSDIESAEILIDLRTILENIKTKFQIPTYFTEHPVSSNPSHYITNDKTDILLKINLNQTITEIRTKIIDFLIEYIEQRRKTMLSKDFTPAFFDQLLQHSSDPDYDKSINEVMELISALAHPTLSTQKTTYQQKFRLIRKDLVMLLIWDEKVKGKSKTKNIDTMDEYLSKLKIKYRDIKIVGSDSLDSYLRDVTTKIEAMVPFLEK